jgi:hypothetical protein
MALGFVAATIAYFLKMPGFFRYLFVAQIISFPYMVSSVFHLLPSFSIRSVPIRTLRIIVTSVFGALICFQAYQVLFSSFVAGYYVSTRTAELKMFAQELDPSAQVFIFHAPEVATFLPMESYSQYIQLLYFNDAIGKEQLRSLQKGAPDTVIVAGDMLSQAEPYLERYQEQKRIDEGRYVIFQRAP